MYNAHFNFEQSPFTLTPDTWFFCSLKPHSEALQTILTSLQNNEGFVKITGPVGTGKTMLCRQLLSKLDDSFAVAYIPNPTVPAVDLYKLIVQELEGELPANADAIVVYNTLNNLLLNFKKNGKRVVLIVDEAQVISDEGLEAIRLLTNLETETSKLLQIVLFGQPELDDRLNSPKFLHLKQRIIFSYLLKPLTKHEFFNYIQHRIIKASQSYQQVFHQQALDMIYKASEGIPRVVNILCHKSLIAAFSRGEKFVTKKSANAAVKDTFDVTHQSKFALFLSRPTLTQTIVLVVLLTALIDKAILLWRGF